MTLSDVFGHSLLRLHRECPKAYAIYSNTGKEKGRKKQESQNPPKNQSEVDTDLEDRNLLKLRSLDSLSPFFLSHNSIWGQRT